MENPRFPRTTKALAAYGPNLYAQAQKTGIPYTTLREWFLYGRLPNIGKLAAFPDLLAAFTEDMTHQPVADARDLAQAPVEKTITPIFETIGKRRKLVGFDASYNGFIIGRFDSRDAASAALDAYAYEELAAA